MKEFQDLMAGFAGKEVLVDKAFLLRVYAALGTASFVPSMFGDVRDIITTLDAHLGESHEGDDADRTTSDGSDS